MLFYCIFTYFIVGIAIGIFLLQAKADKSHWANDKHGNIDIDIGAPMVFAFLFSPLTFPISIFFFIIHKIAKFLYTRFFNH